jgi:hypothetical protein
MNKKGDWMQTYGGMKFWPLDPDPDRIIIEDIAHALSNICRYGGHARKFYSVAEHSVHVSNYVLEKYALEGLLDDAAEAYIGDMIRPIKYSIKEYCKIDTKLSQVIRVKFGAKKSRDVNVEFVDNSILLDEADQVMGGQVDDWGLLGSRLDVKIEFWSPEIAEMKFLNRFKELIGK